MSWLEILLFGFSFIYIITNHITKINLTTMVNLLALTGFGFLMGHILFDVTNWQLYPLYFFIAMSWTVTIVGILMRKNDQIPRDNKKKIAIIGTTAIVLSGMLMLIFPVYEIPAPEGEYAIGTFTFELTDPDRVEMYGKHAEASDSLRRLRVQLWYPSDQVNGYKRVAWLQDGIKLSRSLAKEMKLPFFVLDHTKDVLSNAYLEAPISDDKDKFPVIVLSHGWMGFRNLHNDFAELLASNGYVVLGIDHTYGSQLTLFDDGFAAELYKSALPDRDSTSDFLDYANQLVLTYAGDIKLVLDSLESLNDGEYSKSINGELDLSRIGLMGHSTGGGAGVSAALNDDRVKSIFGMDAWVEPLGMETMTVGLSIPALFLRSEQWEGGLNDNYLTPLVQASNDAKLIQIDGTTHIDFTMSTMFSSLTGIIGFTGKLDREQSASLQHDYVLEFFNQSLNKEN
jgi:pimeloyl-ACP methyl ester carboxylesterase